MLNPTVKINTDAAIRRLDRLPPSVRARLRPAVVQATQMISDRVTENLSGAVLNKRTGKLLSSKRVELRETPYSIAGRIYMDMSVAPYAAIHEFGGVIKHPGSSKFQAWKGTSGWVYTHYTKPHDIPIPQRSYLNSALESLRETIESNIRQAAFGGAREAA